MFEDRAYLDRTFQTCDEDKPLVVQVYTHFLIHSQLCGNDPMCIRNAAIYFAKDCNAVDLNLGCPQVSMFFLSLIWQGIARKGHYGSFLLPDYDRIEQIAKALGSMEVPIPFTVKIRLLPKMEDTLRLCKMLEREGAQLITVVVFFPY